MFVCQTNISDWSGRCCSLLRKGNLIYEETPTFYKDIDSVVEVVDTEGGIVRVLTTLVQEGPYSKIYENEGGCLFLGLCRLQLDSWYFKQVPLF